MDTETRPRLQPGQQVRVYQDPMTREVLEGEAVLVEFECVDPDLEGLERWTVRFPGEPVPFYRTVHVNDVTREAR